MIEISNDLPILLLVDDDKTFCEVLGAALVNRGFCVRIAHGVDQGIRLATLEPPEYAIVDLRMSGPSGLALVKELRALDENTRIVVLTGYASIATAVEAIKLGATHYLAKPADVDEIVAALHKDEGNPEAPVDPEPLSAARMEWEYVQRTLADCGGNISEAARRLRMHRRTLQRKLAKRPAVR